MNKHLIKPDLYLPEFLGHKSITPTVFEGSSYHLRRLKLYQAVQPYNNNNCKATKPLGMLDLLLIQDP
jgi:hypothetical protein